MIWPSQLSCLSSLDGKSVTWKVSVVVQIPPEAANYSLKDEYSCAVYMYVVCLPLCCCCVVILHSSLPRLFTHSNLVSFLSISLIEYHAHIIVHIYIYIYTYTHVHVPGTCVCLMDGVLLPAVHILVSLPLELIHKQI